jgi:hypothetical protein
MIGCCLKQKIKYYKKKPDTKPPKSLPLFVLFLFLTKEAYSHGGLQTGKLGQTPLSVDQPQSEH